MSLIFSAGELSDMMGAQEAHMMDTCLIAEPTVTTNEYNLTSESWNWSAATESICGFDGHPSKELLDQVPFSEAVVRLPKETTISTRARLRITERFGESQVSPVTYEAIGAPRLGPSGLLLWLKQVTDGS